MKCCEYGPRSLFLSLKPLSELHFLEKNAKLGNFVTGPFHRYQSEAISSTLMNWLNKLECCITRGWKALPGANTLAYWAQTWICTEGHSIGTINFHFQSKILINLKFMRFYGRKF
jgi:hypothetical protein